MKKIISLLVIFCLLLPVSGCFSGFDEREYIDKVLEYLSKDDAESLKSLFCPIITDLEDFDKELQKAFTFFYGKIVSYSSPQGRSGKSWDGGLVRYYIAPYIKSVETDTGEIYDIVFYSWIVNEDYPDRVGISEIVIEDENGNVCNIGDYNIVNPE